MIETADEFRSLRESENADEYNRAARDTASLEVWLDVINRMPDMRFWVAQNKTVPVEVLQILAEDSDFRVRGMVARKRKLPKTLQLKLSMDPESTVRASLASNAKLTPEVRGILAEDRDPLVRNTIKHEAENA